MYNEKIDNIHIMSNTCDCQGGRNVPIKNIKWRWQRERWKQVSGIFISAHGRKSPEIQRNWQGRHFFTLLTKLNYTLYTEHRSDGDMMLLRTFLSCNVPTQQTRTVYPTMEDEVVLQRKSGILLQLSHTLNTTIISIKCHVFYQQFNFDFSKNQNIRCIVTVR